MDANRMRVASVVETTLGTTPASPRMRTARITGESLQFTPQNLSSNELRSDRMNGQPVQIFQSNTGGVNFEFVYPYDQTFMSDCIRSAMYNTWVNTPVRDNDGTADSVITDIGTVADTLTFTTGAAFIVGHLIYNSGYSVSNQNGLFRVTTGGATSLVSSSSSWTATAAPPAAARTKVVGFQGASADLAITSTGMTTSALNFINLGVTVGCWLKIGGTGAAFRYATAADNDWVRVTAVAATTLTFDNRPVGWTADVGTGKTIRVFMGDRIFNGTTRTSLSIERGYLGNVVPSYVMHAGMVVGTFGLNMQSRQMVTGSIGFEGTAATLGTVAGGASYDAATTDPVLASNVSVGRIAEAGVTVASPNWVRNFTMNLNNNLRVLDAIGYSQAIDIGAGECSITGTADTYYGDTTLYQKLLSGTPSGLSTRQGSGNKFTVMTLPQLLFTGGSPNASGKNTDVILPLAYEAFMDPLTNTMISFDRFDYAEILP